MGMKGLNDRFCELREEVRIALISILIIFVSFNIVKALLFTDQGILWHLWTAFWGLLAILFFGFIVLVIDIYLDKIYPFEKNVARRIGIQFFITVLVILIIRLVPYIFLRDKYPIHLSREAWVATLAINIYMVLCVILSIFGYHFFRRWREEKITAADLEKEKALVQYDNLKNQLNPHFLFNSLSSLNSLIFENPQLASEFLQQLSKVFRYVLENKEKNLVPLRTEVNFVNQYAALLKTRFDEALQIDFDISSTVHEKKIVPVTLQVLLENAIKHNITAKDNPLRIRVYDADGYLVVENILQKKDLIETSNGQGLENLRNLYRFLTDVPVDIEQTSTKFAVKVPLIS